MRAMRSAILVVAGSMLGACAPKQPCANSTLPPSVPAPVAVPATAAQAPAVVPAPVPAQSAHQDPGTDVISVTLSNPLAVARSRETIALSLAELGKVVAQFDPKTTFVVDGGGATVLSQLVDLDGDESPDELLFQADLGANETKVYRLRIGQRPQVFTEDYKVYGRFVRERHDDFAWENDFVAHRMYGPDLETYKKDPLVSSGIDVWVKRVRRLIVNEWYMTDNYHQDFGDGADFYAVKKTRGCGGLGIWAGGKLAVSKNFATSRILANGPIRLVFELSYAPWAAGAVRVSEVKRVALDAGSLFNHFESRITGTRSFSVGIGISKHPGAVVEADPKSGWMRSWEPLQEGKSGNLGCAVVLPPGSSAEQQQLEGDNLLVTPASATAPTAYYVGTAWDRGGRVPDSTAFGREVEGLASRLAAPVKVSLAALASK
jgi:hypothetical protein